MSTPPQQQPWAGWPQQPQVPQPQPPKKKRRGLKILGGVVAVLVIVGIAASAGGGDDDTTAKSAAETKTRTKGVADSEKKPASDTAAFRAWVKKADLPAKMKSATGHVTHVKASGGTFGTVVVTTNLKGDLTDSASTGAAELISTAATDWADDEIGSDSTGLITVNSKGGQLLASANFGKKSGGSAQSDTARFKAWVKQADLPSNVKSAMTHVTHVKAQGSGIGSVDITTDLDGDLMNSASTGTAQLIVTAAVDWADATLDPTSVGLASVNSEDGDLLANGNFGK
ncbi:hypothetical protein [Streptomyces sp. VRA16 Mangrove soil]|uniref:hypothetical protein n=1 Tax=Streptomyces sp. VRA16 Mangrove soil TaxID=2817434 RepID=UPI001A9E027B|nr:hypothetical protein [Streptomyces sp. VRA16 Mangrove soil]MBO1337553.1 hypothetical protein [Streptomyces sp. VRA16 Mangrove soil]